MPGQATVKAKDKQWSVSVANTYAELTQGLSGLSSMPAGTGMLFDLGSDQSFIQIDMTRMLFALDIIFINSTQGVRGVMRNVQPGETDVRFEATTTPGARCFLEVNAGEAEGIEVGDNVAIQGLVPQNAGLDLTGLMNFMVIFVVIVMMFRVVDRALEAPKERPKMLGYGKPPPGYEPVHHSSERRYGEPKTEAERGEAHERKYGTKETPARGLGLKERGGTCYEDAWRFIIKAEEGELVHGTILTKGRRIGHAWVVLPTGYTFEPQSGSFPTTDYFYTLYSPTEEHRYSAEEATILGARTGHFGPWTEEEREQFLTREHHSMWLTPEQRKGLEEKYGAVTVRWAEEATRPGDIKGVEAAAEYYYGKLKEVFGLGHLSPELTEEQLRKLREFLGLPADVAEVLKIHRETGYIP